MKSVERKNRPQTGLLFFLLVSVALHLVLLLLDPFRGGDCLPDVPAEPIPCRLFLPPGVEVPEAMASAVAAPPAPPPTEEAPPAEKAEEPEALPLPAPPPLSLPEAVSALLQDPWPSPPGPTALELYTSRLWAEIYRQRKYPPEAAQLGWEGEVVVVFTLDREGTLRNLGIPAGGESRFAAFNREALRAVREAAAAFPPFPDGLSGAEMTWQLVIAFRLP